MRRPVSAFSSSAAQTDPFDQCAYRPSGNGVSWCVDSRKRDRASVVPLEHQVHPKLMIRFGLLSSVFRRADVRDSALDEGRTRVYPNRLVRRIGRFLSLDRSFDSYARRSVFQSRPNRLLVAACAGSVILPYDAARTRRSAGFDGFRSVASPLLLAAVGSIVLLYMVSIEILKRRFYPDVERKHEIS